MNILLNARQPFRFHSVVHSHGWYQLAPFEWDEARGVLNRVEQLSSDRVVLMQISGTLDGVAVDVQGRLGKRERDEIGAKVSWMFALDADFSEFYAMAEREPHLAHCREKASGRLLRSSTLWEDVVRVMMTTNIQWSGTKRLVAQLVGYFGAPMPNDPARRAFPRPETIARSRETTLRKLGLGYRAPYLLQLARGVVAGTYDLENLKDPARSTEQLRRELLALPGIGPYAAATLLGLLGHYDFIGVDSEALSLVSKGFYHGQPIGAKEVEATFARWGKFKSLAYWFWDWNSQQQPPMQAWEERKAANAAPAGE